MIAPQPVPPGPPGLPVIGSALAYRKDPFGFLERIARTYGEVVYSRFAGQHFYMITRPEHVEQVLVGRRERYGKDRFIRTLAVVIGQGLLVSEGALWRQQRRRMAPAFAHRHVGGYARTISGCAGEHAAAWSAGVIDVGAAMMRMTLDIALRALFGGGDPRAGASDDDALRVGRAFTTVSEFFADAVGKPVPLPLWVPTARHRGLRRAIAELDVVVARVIGQRRAAPPVPGDSPLDLLGMLLAARDDDGAAMDDRQLRDEVLTLLLAGHETTALTLTYALALIARDPEVQARLAAEVAQLGGAAPTLEDLPRLAYCEQVALETMRLYPAAATLGREVLEPDEIGGYPVPRGATVVLSPWVIHRDPRHYAEPLRFWPGRWTAEFRRQLPRFAYFPFGGGQRVCIGEAFAMLEVRLALAAIVSRWQIAAVDDAPLAVVQAITVRPKDPVRLRLSPREAPHG